MADYICTDERQDVLASLEQCALSLLQAQQSDRAWKWVILSLHSALQGAMVCHLSGSARLGSLIEQKAKKSLEWLKGDRRGNSPKEFVAPAGELFKRLSCPSLRIEGGCGGIISISEEQRKSFKRLNDLRNELTHFSPKGWSIEIKFIEESIDDVLDILSLILNDDWPFQNMPEEDKSALESKIEEIRSYVSQC